MAHSGRYANRLRNRLNTTASVPNNRSELSIQGITPISMINQSRTQFQILDATHISTTRSQPSSTGSNNDSGRSSTASSRLQDLIDLDTNSGMEVDGIHITSTILDCQNESSEADQIVKIYGENPNHALATHINAFRNVEAVSSFRHPFEVNAPNMGAESGTSVQILTVNERPLSKSFEHVENDLEKARDQLIIPLVPPLGNDDVKLAVERCNAASQREAESAPITQSANYADVDEPIVSVSMANALPITTKFIRMYNSDFDGDINLMRYSFIFKIADYDLTADVIEDVIVHDTNKGALIKKVLLAELKSLQGRNNYLMKLGIGTSGV